MLIENHMNYCAMHTNFDVAVMGEIAGELLGLKISGPLEVPEETQEAVRGIGCVGELSKTCTLKYL